MKVAIKKGNKYVIEDRNPTRELAKAINSIEKKLGMKISDFFGEKEVSD